MKLVHGQLIKSALRELSASRIAVAYVGSDWRSYIDPAQLHEIIVSPTVGSNPKAIAEIAAALEWDNVHFLDSLHAKIYIGATAAVIGSFNLTSNGLSGLPTGLDEIGCVTEDAKLIAELHARLDDYKAKAQAMYPSIGAKRQALARLREIWDRGIKTKVLTNDTQSAQLQDYLPLAADEFYVCWIWGDVELDAEVVEPGTLRDYVAFAENDEIQPDRWLLCWHVSGENGAPDSRRKPYWLHIDEVVSKGAPGGQYTKVAIERNDTAKLEPPFELDTAVFRGLRKVLKSGNFDNFLYKENWSVNPTIEQLPAFLQALREASQPSV